MIVINTRKTGYFKYPVFLFFFLFASSLVTNAQVHEFGIGVGINNYSGELNRFPHLLNSRPTGQIFYRWNTGKVVVLRVNANIGSLAGDERYNEDTIKIVRNGSFSGTTAHFALLLEYNFFNYRDKKTPIKFCPYIVFGIAGLYSSIDAKSNVVPEDYLPQTFNFAIPFGIGFKYPFAKVWNVGAELVANKLFTDHLDGISNGMINGKATGDPIETDWFYTFGINISYTIYKVDCPQE